mgnify:CR=1 FL=1
MDWLGETIHDFMSLSNSCTSSIWVGSTLSRIGHGQLSSFHDNVTSTGMMVVVVVVVEVILSSSVACITMDCEVSLSVSMRTLDLVVLHCTTTWSFGITCVPHLT